MRAQKDAYNKIMTHFYEHGNSHSSSRVSVLTSALQVTGELDVETSCYIVQGVLRPCTDSAHYHEYLTDTHGWTITIRCLNSSKLETELYKWNRIQPCQSRHNFGVLNFNTNTIETQQANHLTLTVGRARTFTMHFNSENGTDQAAYKYVDSDEV